MGNGATGGSWQRDVRDLLRQLRHERSITSRMAKAAESLLGRPYCCNPLGGGSGIKERLTVSLDGFDCVTFVENLLALARSDDPKGFVDELAAIRYRDGQVSWQQRLHYFSDWMTSNQRRGAIRIRTRGAGSRCLDVRLSLIAELGIKKIRLCIVPKREILKATRRIHDGTIVAFASLRAGLDFFHVGVLFWQHKGCVAKDELLLYHAARSANCVVVEPLADFLRRNRMRGIAFAEPLGKGD